MPNNDGDLVTGMMRICSRHANTIYITVENDEDVKRLNIDYGDVHEAVCRFFVDRHGFATTEFKVTKAASLENDVTAKIEFTNEGAVMAKLQGFLE